MDKIFYGAGSYAITRIDDWLAMDIIPVCFSDIDECKHYSFISSSGGEEFEILPIDEAVKRYPNYELCVTVNPGFVENVYNWLIGYSIPPERIKYHPEHRGIPKNCPHIGEYLVIDGFGIKTCCEGNVVNQPSTGNFRNDIVKYMQYCTKLRDDLNNGKFTSCIECHMLRDGRSYSEIQIKRVNLSTGLPGGDCCNLKCIYCTYGESLGACNREESVYDMLLILSEQPNIDHITYACGDLSVSPHREEIFALWKKEQWRGTIFINAAIYCDSISELLSAGLININVSLDAGTSVTFEKIKGVDCFKNVIENVKRYASADGLIELKYILLEGNNTNENDLRGFVRIAKEINSRVIISRDCRIINTRMSELEYSMLLALAQLCNDHSIPYLIAEAYVVMDLNRLKSDNLL